MFLKLTTSVPESSACVGAPSYPKKYIAKRMVIEF